MTGLAKGGTKLAFGDYGIQALEPGWLTNRQIEAARIAMTRHIKRGGKVWITVFPDKPVTQKPAETRMGSGKGNPEKWVAVVKPGRVLFELSGVPEPIAREAMRLAIHKLPIKARFIVREGGGVADDEAPASCASSPTRCWRTASPRRRTSCSTSGSSTRPASSTTPPRFASVRRDDRADPHADARARDRARTKPTRGVA